MYILIKNGALLEVGLVHCGICVTGLFGPHKTRSNITEYNTAVTEKHRPDFQPTKDTLIARVKASYGVSFASIWEEMDLVKRACAAFRTWIHVFWTFSIAVFFAIVLSFQLFVPTQSPIYASLVAHEALYRPWKFNICTHVLHAQFPL